MAGLNKRIEELEYNVKEISKKMSKEYKLYTDMECLFFENLYREKITEAFDTKSKKIKEEL